jgi:hypothetical protein
LLSALAELVVEGVTSMKEMNRKDKEYADEVAGGRGSKKVKG